MYDSQTLYGVASNWYDFEWTDIWVLISAYRYYCAPSESNPVYTALKLYGERKVRTGAEYMNKPTNSTISAKTIKPTIYHL
jgi:hypothetical protein